MKERFRVTKSAVLQVYGKAFITVVKGEINIFNKTFLEGETLEVPLYRSYPIESMDSSVIEVEFFGKKPEFRRGVGTGIWKTAIDEYLKDPGDAVVIGSTDSGKTGLSKYLVNILLSRGYTVSIIDLDPGQGDIGLPGFIGGAYVHEPLIELDWAKDQIYRFIGSTSPIGRESIIEEFTRDLLSLLTKTDYRIINLHGWIKGYRAIKHVSNIIKSTGVQNIFYLSEPKIDPYVNYLHYYLRLNNPKTKLYKLIKANVIPRSRIIRKKIRECKYSKFIKSNTFANINVYIPEINLNSRYIESGNIPNDLIYALMGYHGINRKPDAIVLKELTVRFLYESNKIKKPIYWINRRRLSPPLIIYLLPIEGYAILSAMVNDNNHIPIFIHGFDLKNHYIKIYVPRNNLHHNISNLFVGRIIIDMSSGKEIGLLKIDIF